MSKKIAIIGAGIAGLSAGCYARMNGYEAEIYEMHTQPGGLCTSWTKKGYTIDGCIHWLTGSSPADPFYRIWMELGALQGRHIVDQDVFYRITGSDGRTLVVYTNIDRLEAHLLELAPADAKATRHFCRLLRRFTKFTMPIDKAPELFGFFDVAKTLVKLLPFMKDFQFCNTTSIGDYTERFTDPLIREMFSHIFYSPRWTLFGLIVTLALLHNRAGGYPIGGSLAFSRAIERRYLDLGGTVHYRSPVAKILEEHGAATGLRLRDGTEIKADYVISAADMRTTLHDMLDGKHMDPVHAQLLSGGELFPSCVQVSFGVDMDLSHEPPCLGEILKLPEPVKIGNESTEWLSLKTFSYDPSLAPPGKSIVESLYLANDFAYWEELYRDRERYRAEKERITQATAAVLERRYPGFSEKIEVSDVVTPMTYVRYTGNWKGSFMTWMPTPETGGARRSVPKTVPGLENFWMSGMWVLPPGGIPTGAKTSRDILQVICKRDGKRFSAPVAGGAS